MTVDGVKKKMRRILQQLAALGSTSYKIPEDHVVVKLGTRKVVYSYAANCLVGVDTRYENGNTSVFKGVDRSDEASAVRWLQEGLVNKVMDE